MNSKATVVALNEDANIYLVVDEGGQPIGTGSREVCEALAQLSMTANTSLNGGARTTLERENICSAIKV
jgi:hypothetical protein